MKAPPGFRFLASKAWIYLARELELSLRWNEKLRFCKITEITDLRSTIVRCE